MFTFKVLASILLNTVIFAGLLFLPAGTLVWWRAWVFLGVVLIGTVATMACVFPGRKDLLEERLKPPLQRGQPRADKIAVLLLLAAYIGQMVLIPLDVFHLHLLDRPGVVFSSLGLLLVIARWWIISLALRENRFAAPVVKSQAERGHKVIDSGVYGVVRHPMYAGAILFFIGLPLWLESWAATVAAIAPGGALILRILVEERFLRRELPGYDAYTQRVRQRLIPFIW